MQTTLRLVNRYEVILTRLCGPRKLCPAIAAGMAKKLTHLLKIGPFDSTLVWLVTTFFVVLSADLFKEDAERGI